MFIEIVQYSIQSISSLVSSFLEMERAETGGILPISTNTNNSKCLDYDMDNVILFDNLSCEKYEVASIKKSFNDVMEMV